jgi:hypothetical protein
MGESFWMSDDDHCGHWSPDGSVRCNMVRGHLGIHGVLLRGGHLYGSWRHDPATCWSKPPTGAVRTVWTVLLDLLD